VTTAVGQVTQTGLPRGDRPKGADEWAELLEKAFEDAQQSSSLLALAEDALRSHPGEALILCFAATAALFEQRSDKAFIFLKRYFKRYVPSDTYYLLRALAFGQRNQFAPARAILKRHGLDSAWAAVRAFPGGRACTDWLLPRLDAIHSSGRSGSCQPATRHAAARSRTRIGEVRHGSRQRVVPPDPVPDITQLAAPTRLLLNDIDIPLAMEIDLSPLKVAMKKEPEADGGWYLLRERFAHLGLAQGFDELMSLPHLHQLEMLRHQIETARKVLKQFRGRVLLADEVGLGKTIEAGLVMKEYLLRGMVETVLVLVPAALVGQWREELGSKFDIQCATTQDAALRRDPDRFWGEKRLIASLALARLSEHAEQLLSRSFDLVIVDEAHQMRDRSSRSYKLVDGLNKRFLLLLSATPVQNDLTELYNLLTLLKPGIFRGLKEFRAAYTVSGRPRQPANPESLRELMRAAMIRNTRAALALKLPRREAITIRVDGSESERDAYEELMQAVRGLPAEDNRRLHRLAIRHLLGAAGSSPAAARAALSRFAARHPDTPAWARLAQQWAAVGIGAKDTTLLGLLRRYPSEKKVVFVHYRDTLNHLAELLAHEGIGFARFDGSLSGTEKDATIEQFRERVPVLLSTESGGEGRNLQFCNTIINFDVPWNPMTIEQRIGRIDRIGQQRDVFVFNLVTRRTLEEEVLHLLDEKISMFELVVGEVGAILGNIEEDRDFAELVLDAWLQTTDTTRSDAFDIIGQRLEQARHQHEAAKALDSSLFGENFETA
jgi:superfamily II DNA or RNA helicase